MVVVVVQRVQQLMGNPSSSLEKPVWTFLHSPTRGSFRYLQLSGRWFQVRQGRGGDYFTHGILKIVKAERREETAQAYIMSGKKNNPMVHGLCNKIETGEMGNGAHNPEMKQTYPGILQKTTTKHSTLHTVAGVTDLPLRACSHVSKALQRIQNGDIFKQKHACWSHGQREDI